MSVYKREGTYYIELRWHGYPRIRVSAHTALKGTAQSMEAVLKLLKEEGRRDLLGLLANRRLDVGALVAAYKKNPDELKQVQIKAESPLIGGLLDEWYGWLDSPLGLSRRRSRYAPNTIHRYKMSWQKLLAGLAKGRETALNGITDGLVADYKVTRTTGGAEPATVNRDLCAIQAFLTWCTKQKHLEVQRPEFVREREPSGRERWLSPGELRRLHSACPPEWWPLFATLVYTGLRIGEAQGLRGEDLRFGNRVIVVRKTDERTLKTAASDRDVPMPKELATVLAAHCEEGMVGPADPVFAPPFSHYQTAYRRFKRTCEDAGIHDASPHVMRHTFGVHAAISGVPVPRIQKLLGHATPYMALKYARHAPEPFFAEDAARVAKSLNKRGTEEADERAKLTQAARKAG